MTVSVEPGRHRLERLLRALRHFSRPRSVTLCIAAVAVVAALAGAAVGKLAGSKTNATHGRPAEASMLAEAAVYRFPLGCLGSTLSGRSSLRADGALSRLGPCWHYGVYLTAVLRRVDGVWRLTLDTRGNSCPDVPLPASVRALLAACAKRDAAAVHRASRHSPRRSSAR